MALGPPGRRDLHGRRDRHAADDRVRLQLQEAQPRHHRRRQDILPYNLTYIEFDSTKGLQANANYLWNDEYTLNQAGSRTSRQPGQGDPEGTWGLQTSTSSTPSAWGPSRPTGKLEVKKTSARRPTPASSTSRSTAPPTQRDERRPQRHDRREDAQHRHPHGGRGRRHGAPTSPTTTSRSTARARQRHRRSSPPAADDAGPLNVTVTTGSDIVCTITNTRETGKLEVKKNLSPTNDPGQFDLQIDGITDPTHEAVGTTARPARRRSTPAPTRSARPPATARPTSTTTQVDRLRRHGNGNRGRATNGRRRRPAERHRHDRLRHRLHDHQHARDRQARGEEEPQSRPTTPASSTSRSTASPTPTPTASATTARRARRRSTPAPTRSARRPATAHRPRRLRQVDRLRRHGERQPGSPPPTADDAGPLNVSVTTGSDIVCTITNTRETGKLEVKKNLSPDHRPRHVRPPDRRRHRPQRRRASATTARRARRRSTPAPTRSARRPATAHRPGRLRQVDRLRGHGERNQRSRPPTADDAGPLNVNVTTGSDIVCTITNTRETGKLEVKKNLSPDQRPRHLRPPDRRHHRPQRRRRRPQRHDRREDAQHRHPHGRRGGRQRRDRPGRLRQVDRLHRHGEREPAGRATTPTTPAR